MSGDIWTTVTDVATAAAKGAAAGSIVPGVGTIVGGLIGAAASIGGHWLPEAARPALAQAAAAITGVSDEAGQVAAIAADPAHADAFRLEVLRIAADERTAERQADADRLTAALADVADARRMMLALASQGSTMAWGAPIVSVIVLTTFGAVVALVLFRAVPSGSEPVLNVLLGTLGAMATTVVGYWVGSSVGSAKKDDRLAKLEAVRPA